MSENINAEQLKKLEVATKIPRQEGIIALDDDTLEAVSGGEILEGTIKVYKCVLCGWTCATNNDNLIELANSHMASRLIPNCKGKFGYVDFRLL